MIVRSRYVYAIFYHIVNIYAMPWKTFSMILKNDSMVGSR
jgi:hypothetical protein